MAKDVFFFEATLRICGSLEIEEALLSTFCFLRDIMPIDICVLEYVDQNY